MHPQIEAYLKQKNDEAKRQKEAAKQDFLLREGLFEKEYSPDDTWSEEYCHSEYDSEQQKTRHYKKVPIAVADEEFDLLLQCRRAQTADGTDHNGVAVALRVIAWLIYIAGAIAFLFFAISVEDGALGLSSALGALISGTLFLGFSEVVKLLTAIKNK